MAWYLLLLIIFLVFAFFLGIIYWLASQLPSPYREIGRTWVLTYSIEMAVLLVLPRGVYLPGLPKVYSDGGMTYVLILSADLGRNLPVMLHGHHPDYWLLVLLPLVPALLAWRRARRRQAARR